MLNRRKFLELVGALGVVVITPLDKVVKKLSVNPSSSIEARGELYEEFLILDENEPVPSFVQAAPSPILGELDKADEANPTIAAYKGATTWFNDIEELRKSLHFHLFIPQSLPNRMVFLQGYVLRFAGTGDVWEARLDFGFEENREPLISVSARPIFHKPYPIWPVLVFPKKEKGEPILDEEYTYKKPEKVTFTPRKGIKLLTENGFTLQWIKKDILYTVFMEYAEWADKAENFGKLLIEN